MRTTGRIQCRKSACGGFSIVELLVVMGILSLLISLLLPALSRVRDRSRDIKCRSHLRQIGLGAAGYSGDWFDIVPREGIAPWFNNRSTHHFIPWVEALRKYLIQGSDEQLASPVYLDPAHPNPNHLVHYVINGIRVPSRDGRYWFFDADRRPAGPASQIRYPDRMIYMTELTDDRDNSIAKNVRSWDLKMAAGVYDVWNYHHFFGHDINSDPNAIYVRRVGPRRHGENNNALFIDGHCESLPWKELFDVRRWADGS